MTVALRVELTRVSYGDRAVLRDVVLEVGQGEIVGVTGHVGAQRRLRILFTGWSGCAGFGATL